MTARPVSEIMAEIQADTIAENASLCYWGLNSMNRKTNVPIAIQIQKLETKIEAAADAQNINTATGSDLDELVKDRGLTRLSGEKAMGVINFVCLYAAESDITIPAGTTVIAPALDGDPVYLETIIEVILTEGKSSVSADAECTKSGIRGNIRAGAITDMLGGIPGIDYCENVLPFFGGTDKESDDELRMRYIATATEYGRSTLPTTKERLEALYNDDNEKIVAEAKVYNMGAGVVQIIVDVTDVAENELTICNGILDCISGGIFAGGMLAAHIGGAGDHIVGEVVNETPDGIITTFTVDDPFITLSEEVKLNGVTQIRNVDYTPTPETGTIEVLWSPIPDAAIGDIITVNYSVDPINQGDLGDADGGGLWALALVNVISEDIFSIDYVNQDGITHTANFTIPIGTVKGSAIQGVLEEETDEVVSVPDPPTYNGAFEYELRIGHGDYPSTGGPLPLLFLTPEKVTIDITLTFTATETSPITLEDDIQASIEAFLDDFAIGEELQFSDLYDAARYNYAANENYAAGDRFDLDSIDYISATDGNTTISVLGEKIVVEGDSRIDPGDVVVTPTS